MIIKYGKHIVFTAVGKLYDETYDVIGLKYYLYS